MNTLEAAFGQLPEPILNKLDLMIRRIRRLLFLRGLFATLAVAFGCLLAIMAVDAAFTLFSTTSRWILSLTGLAITAIAAWWFLARPLSRRFTLTHMARILEIRHPELQERISTAVELLSSDDPESIKGSEELI
jgi:cytochrome c biogenesis protein CcdA